jgi:hypothetical protein
VILREDVLAPEAELDMLAVLDVADSVSRVHASVSVGVLNAMLTHGALHVVIQRVTPSVLDLRMALECPE